jgi:hypothetical protein
MSELNESDSVKGAKTTEDGSVKGAKSTENGSGTKEKDKAGMSSGVQTESAKVTGATTTPPSSPFLPASRDREEEVEDRQAKRARRRLTMSPEKELPPSRVRGMGRVPQIPEFGNYPPVEQFREWMEYLELVDATTALAPGWDEAETAAYFKIICGANLRRMISAYGLAPERTSRPFTRLIENITSFLKSLSDPVLEQQELQQCRQREGESASDYYVRLVQLVRHRPVDGEFLRMHYISNLRDTSFKNLAITAGWNMVETVAAATRSEAANKNVREQAQQLVAAVSAGREAQKGRYAGGMSRGGTP